VSWYNLTGPEGFIVISSRMRIARNVEKYNFPNRLNDTATKELLENLTIASGKLNGTFKLYHCEHMSQLDTQILIEKHLISPALVEIPMNRAALIKSDESVSVMFNEEDHIRIQALVPGFDLEKSLKQALIIDDVFVKELPIAFSQKLGYLSCCPTNVGTGLRASVMIHLPALTQSGQIDELLQAVRRMGITVRGIYGEGSNAEGSIYQVSNQVTLGISEHDIVTRLNEIIRRIIKKELEIREAIRANDLIKLEDRVWRSYGILKNTRLLTSNELMHYLSNIRMGAAMDIIPVTVKQLNELMIVTQPAHIAKLCGENSSPEARDSRRAEIVREML